MSANATWRSFSSIISGAANICSASTTHMMLSNLIRSRMASSMNVSAMPDGSATPLASSRMYSGCSGRAITCTTAATRSSRMLQQTQPLARLMTSPSFSTPTTSSASMLIEPKSFTNTATRRP